MQRHIQAVYSYHKELRGIFLCFVYMYILYIYVCFYTYNEKIKNMYVFLHILCIYVYIYIYNYVVRNFVRICLFYTRCKSRVFVETNFIDSMPKFDWQIG